MQKIRSNLVRGLEARLFSAQPRCGQINRLHQRVIAEIPLDRRAQVLDVCCGTGALLASFRYRYPARVSLVGVDADANLLNKVRPRAKELMLTLRTGCSYRLPFQEQTFHWVLSILALHRMTHPLKRVAIAEAARVLKPGGRLLVADVGAARNIYWGLIGKALNFHAYTRGNIDTVECALQKQRLTIEKSVWHNGLIKLLIARK